MNKVRAERTSNGKEDSCSAAADVDHKKANQILHFRVDRHFVPLRQSSSLYSKHARTLEETGLKLMQIDFAHIKNIFERFCVQTHINTCILQQSNTLP
jgi:hypothetical protein